MKRQKVRLSGSELSLRVAAYLFTILSVCLLLYPMVYTLSSAAKDEVKIYDVPPSLLPDAAQSLSVVLDYSAVDASDEAPLLDAMKRDAVLVLFSSAYEYPRDSLFEIKVYGQRDGNTVFAARAHKMKIQLEKDFGPYKGAVIKSDVLLYGDRYLRAMDSIGWQFDLAGLPESPDLSKSVPFQTETMAADFSEAYPTAGHFVQNGLRRNNGLLLESFRYYFELPSYAYPSNEVIARFSFGAFIFNTLLVLVWALVTQTFLSSIAAFAVSRLLSKKTGNLVLLFFLGATMIPFASIMLPQLIMYREMGFYNNYAALLVPYLCPLGFYIYLFKGFFDQIPGSYFEAARLDGASNFYLYTKICLPLSKPILSLIGLQIFLANWNDFFWAWMVTEDQGLWTLNVALYNLSSNTNVKQNFIMGLSVVTILPVLLVTILCSKQLKQSVMSSGVKG